MRHWQNVAVADGGAGDDSPVEGGDVSLPVALVEELGVVDADPVVFAGGIHAHVKEARQEMRDEHHEEHRTEHADYRFESARGVFLLQLVEFLQEADGADHLENTNHAEGFQKVALTSVWIIARLEGADDLIKGHRPAKVEYEPGLEVVPCYEPPRCDVYASFGIGSHEITDEVYAEEAVEAHVEYAEGR